MSVHGLANGRLSQATAGKQADEEMENEIRKLSLARRTGGCRCFLESPLRPYHSSLVFEEPLLSSRTEDEKLAD